MSDREASGLDALSEKLGIAKADILRTSILVAFARHFPELAAKRLQEEIDRIGSKRDRLRSTDSAMLGACHPSGSDQHAVLPFGKTKA